MSNQEEYVPSPASGAEIKKDGEAWTLVMVRDLRHAPEKVWAALTDPAQLREWAPYDVDRNLATAGPAKLSWLGAPQATETEVKRADAPKLLELSLGGQATRYELEPQGSGTRLTLWINIGRNYAAMGAAGWHIAFDVLDRLLAGHPIPRIAGPASFKFDGWKRLQGEYAKLFGPA
jgi:uncharacterized protein YndB with AHSA1/START domain